jgi:DNA helicase II / ATP-dependent DNA helicase PcrA
MKDYIIDGLKDGLRQEDDCFHEDMPHQSEEINSNLEEELNYLDETLNLIQRQMESELEDASLRKEEMIAFRREMYEETTHFSRDFTRLTEMNQYLSEVKNQTESYTSTAKRIERYKRMLDSPYFGRFDFQEEGFDREKIYIGLHTVMDKKTQDVWVYDWRAPISSVFYRYELGKASYPAPIGKITGEVFLKRQYKIKHSKFKYFFESNIRITDEALQEILSQNASASMRNIVETLQKEQDQIIRDTENDVLIVQGVAGSGKTSIALHRVAYLLYEGMGSRLYANNVLIISPNDVFSQYISAVLPELGEENVVQATFDDLITSAFNQRYILETRDEQLEMLLKFQHKEKGQLKKRSIEFKGSSQFIELLERLIYEYGHHIIPFEDVYYEGKIIETKQLIKSRFLNNEIGIPMTKQLKRIEKTLWERIHPLQKIRRAKIQDVVAKNPEHQLEIKPFTRLLALKEASALLERIHKFTEINTEKVYQLLFEDRKLFRKLSQGLGFPKEIEEVLIETAENLRAGRLSYEDSAALLYLKLRLEGGNYSDIRQVVIDEAQDYSPIQYEVFKLLFKNAQFTILGDVAQSIEKSQDNLVYDTVAKILGKPKTVKLFLTKGYRSTYEISAFAQSLYGKEREVFPFERHGLEPKTLVYPTIEEINQVLLQDIQGFLNEGFETIAILCKTFEESEDVYEYLNNRSKLNSPRSPQEELRIRLVHPRKGEIEKGILVIPAYGAKGLEFDCVLVYGVDSENYRTSLDQRLLYISCTRALHRLNLYAVNNKSLFL